MTQATAKPIQAEIYWDADRDKCGWVYRVKYADGDEESGPWEAGIVADRIAMAVKRLLAARGVVIYSTDVLVDVANRRGVWKLG